ncbi:hypothetical protein DTW90_18505 [Neorhizobium sp. P12A]|uniref:hypothetical protein n=1 Tax=Neorhizobium sp. P12A TaxID=2268027 RepID=UPI0011EBC32D|nr:hypothetical protein [Neorhizobium sp. P12A]KAA0697423.1 hypothetical protein DTW90_18505 [Neorhizobium sp. P12A]
MAVNSELDELLSDASLETPAAAQQQQENQPAPADTGRARDEQGRFIQTQQEQQPTAQQPETTTGQPDPSGQAGGVPVRAVQDEREKRREAEANAEALRREIAELRGMVTAQRQPQQQHQQEKQPVALWDDPDAFLREQLSPFQSEIQQMREELWESRATALHGADKVEAAKKAAEAMVAANPMNGKLLHQQITASGNPFDNLVKWHQRQQAMTTVGDDPEKWFQSKLEQLLTDPAKQAEILERIRSGAPSIQNNGKPITNFAPSLSRMPSGGNQAPDNDMSDGALFSFATQR